MFKLQLKWNKEGKYIDTVFPPMPYADALFKCREYQARCGHEHTYRIISTGASK